MEKSLVLRPEHVPLKSIYHTVAQIDLPRWAQSVAQKGVVHELPIYFVVIQTGETQPLEIDTKMTCLLLLIGC